MDLNPRGDSSQSHEPAPATDPSSLAMSDLFSALFLFLVALLVIALIQLQLGKRELEVAKRDHQALAQHIQGQVGIYRVVIDKLVEIKALLERAHIPVEVNSKTGEMIIKDDGVLFKVRSAKLNRAAVKLLDQFADIYFSIVLSDQFSEHIRWVVIEGHASADGEQLLNLELSSRRAYAVGELLLTRLSERIFKASPSRVSESERERYLSVCQTQECRLLRRLKDRLLIAGRGEFSVSDEGEERDRTVRFRLHFTSDLFDLYENPESQHLILSPRRVR